MVKTKSKKLKLKVNSIQVLDTMRNTPVKSILIMLLIFFVGIIAYLFINYLRIYVFDSEYRAGVATPISVLSIDTLSARNFTKASDNSHTIFIANNNSFAEEDNALSFSAKLSAITKNTKENIDILNLENSQTWVVNEGAFAEILQSERSFSRIGNIIISGRYIYINPIDVPLKYFVGNYISALIITQYQSDWNNPVLNEYYNSIPNAQEGKLPYPEVIKSYAGKLINCQGITDYFQLLSCEINLALNGYSESIPVAQQSFIVTQLGIEENTIDEIIGLTNISDINVVLAKLQLEENELIYKNWEFEESEITGVINSAPTTNAYNGANAAKVQQLVNDLTAQGWQQSPEDYKTKDSQFGADQSAVVLNLDRDLAKQTLVIFTLDTAQLNVDCFVEGVGQVYCGDNSINKNTGLYLVAFLATEEFKLGGQRT